MKILILSREPRNYSTKRLREAASSRGHEVKVLDTMRFAMNLEEGHPDLYYRNKRIRTYDAVIPRIGASVTFYGTAVVRQLEQMGMFVLNPSHAITVSRDKLRSLQALSRHHIGMPETAFVRSREDILPAIERLGGAPVVIKLLEGTQGVGVILADSISVAQAIIETLQSAQVNVLLQRFVKESRGRDLRAFVVGGQVVAAMRRTAAGDEFRSNLHRGGVAEAVTLAPEYEHTAIRAAQVMGLRCAGVDMLEGDDGPQVMEVNSSPGLAGIERATGIDVAGCIIKHVEEQVRFPEVDIRQRLTVSRGYGVGEFQIARKSDLRGKSLAELALREREINVLSITRNELILPNPQGDTTLLTGDLVVAFGKQQALAELMPERRKRRTKKKKKKKTGAKTAES